jgi:hypothetical protein
MGHGEYSTKSRGIRAMEMGYETKSRDDVFTQNKEGKIHESMDPKNVKFRESCDSVEHPNTTPVQFYLDVTGSMGHIPHQMIKNGLPKMIGSLIQNGVPDVALMFGAIGDHECDRYPLQVAQFESGDAELDMWLTRTYLESGGGPNQGESYLLAWYFAAHHTRTDAFDLRNQKGFVFTVGDEPCLPNLPHHAIKGIMGDTTVGEGTFTREALLAKAQEKNHVYHIFLTHGGRCEVDLAWKAMLGQNLIVIDDHELVGKTISDVILSHMTGTAAPTPPVEEEHVFL